MARRMKLVSEALFSKLLGSQPFEENQLRSEQTDILASKEIPEEIKPALYRDFSRQLTDHRRYEASKPLLVQSKKASKKPDDDPPADTYVPPPPPPPIPPPILVPLKNLKFWTARMAEYLLRLGVTWTRNYKTIVNGEMTDSDINDVVPAMTSHAQYMKKRHVRGTVHKIKQLMKADGAPDPKGYMTPMRIISLMGTRTREERREEDREERREEEENREERDREEQGGDGCFRRKYYSIRWEPY